MEEIVNAQECHNSRVLHNSTFIRVHAMIMIEVLDRSNGSCQLKVLAQDMWLNYIIAELQINSRETDYLTHVFRGEKEMQCNMWILCREMAIKNAHAFHNLFATILTSNIVYRHRTHTGWSSAINSISSPSISFCTSTVNKQVGTVALYCAGPSVHQFTRVSVAPTDWPHFHSSPLLSTS